MVKKVVKTETVITKIVQKETFDRCVELLETLVLAAVTHDTTALDQASGIARQFLTNLKNEE